MLDDYGPAPYYGSGYERYPYDERERRLAMLERENPHLRYDGQNYRYNYDRPQRAPQQTRGPQIKCRPVANFEEANAAMVDMDGTLNVFTDIGNRRIYTKQVGLDGLAVVETYELVPRQTMVDPPLIRPTENREVRQEQVVLSDAVADYIDQVVQDKIQDYVVNMAQKNGGVKDESNVKRNRAADIKSVSGRSAIHPGAADGTGKE